MSAEPKQVTSSEVWTQWESQVVNGFPLRRFLGSSDHSAVFLSEYKAGNLADAAIKFVPADTVQAEAQLAYWRKAARLSHPHLIRLFDMGRCQLGGRDFLFVVMEHAEQTLAEVLSRRALSPDEVKEMLLPTLDALSFLHHDQLAHGRLKPSNILAVGDRLKLASDAIRPTGSSWNGVVGNSSYDPPELKNRGISSAGDIWSLGILLVEAFTQRTPTWFDERCETVSLRASLPPPFMSTVRQCLSLSPTGRPTVIELAVKYGGVEYQPAPAPQPQPQPPSTTAHQPPADEPPRGAATSQSLPQRNRLLLATAAALLISLGVWVGLRPSGTPQADLQPAVVPTPASVAPLAVVKPAVPNPGISKPVAHLPAKPSSPPAATSPSVLLEVSPDVPPHIQDKIRGRVFVTVRVLVDSSGNVVGALPENPGPSKYFARLADNAAREWKFEPVDNQATRVWLLTFTFTRADITTRAAAM